MALGSNLVCRSQPLPPTTHTPLIGWGSRQAYGVPSPHCRLAQPDPVPYSALTCMGEKILPLAPHRHELLFPPPPCMKMVKSWFHYIPIYIRSLCKVPYSLKEPHTWTMNLNLKMCLSFKPICNSPFTFSYQTS